MTQTQLFSSGLELANFVSSSTLKKSSSVFSINKPALKLFTSIFDVLQKSVMANSKPLIITGNSLGGFVASLLTLSQLEKFNFLTTKCPLCITFGSSLIGDEGLQEAISKYAAWISCYLRVVSDQDPIPRVLISQTGVYKPFGTFLEWYKKVAKDNKIGYYDSHKNVSHTSDLSMVIYLKTLTCYWEELVNEAEKRPQILGASLRTRWLFGGTNYRRMIEPLDIAEYYKEACAEALDSCFWAHVAEALDSCFLVFGRFLLFGTCCGGIGFLFFGGFLLFGTCCGGIGFLFFGRFLLFGTCCEALDSCFLAHVEEALDSCLLARVAEAWILDEKMLRRLGFLLFFFS